MAAPGQASYADALRSATEATVAGRKGKLDPAFEVPLLWNFENAQVLPKHVRALTKNINASLQTLDPRYHLAEEKYGAGNTNLDFVSDNTEILEMEGFIMENSVKYGRKCPKCETDQSRRVKVEYERVKEVADRMIVRQLQRHVLNGSPSKNILLVSGDGDFGIVLDILKEKGYTVFLAITCQAKEEFKRTADHVWPWEKMSIQKATRI